MVQFDVDFEWDAGKATSNALKHGVTFEEAESAFRDAFSLTIEDPLHSDDEERFILMGMSERQRLLVVVHTERGEGIRIISAREATRPERKQYEDGS